MAPKLIPRSRLAAEKGITYSRTQLYRMVRAGTFPKPVQLGAKRIAFVEQEIDAWIRERIAARDAATAA